MDIHRWCLIDGAVLKAGGVDVVRGALGPLDELDFILKDSESKAVIVMPPKTLPKPKTKPYTLILKDSESKAVIAMPLYTLTKPKTNPKPL